MNLHAYNIRVGQKGSENFKAVVDKLRTVSHLCVLDFLEDCSSLRLNAFETLFHLLLALSVISLF